MSGNVVGDFRITPHFRVAEMWCPCCHHLDMPNIRKLCARLELVRPAFGPMQIASGYRCLIHNLEVNGAQFSRHLDGKAADIRVLTDGDRYKLVGALLANGFRRIGIGKNIVHADIDDSSFPLMWTYYP
jgi:uncharacterized protein YcbK (DUF882 family)